jgi:hypothetical protein
MLSPAIATNSHTVPGAFSLKIPDAATVTDSFTQQLATALESYLGKNLPSTSLEIDIQTTGSQTSGDRQFLVTVKSQPDPSGTASPAPAPAASTTAAKPTAPALTPSIATTSPSAPTPVPTNEQDAYWAMQPPEVQVLRNIQDEAERTDVAHQLADQGYKIDVPIMVWKWDPLVTMTIRKNSGYTWVPSANQTPPPTVPNCDLPGLPHYDPNNPPDGSILVSTDFAKGLESTSPWPLT